MCVGCVALEVLVVGDLIFDVVAVSGRLDDDDDGCEGGSAVFRA